MKLGRIIAIFTMASAIGLQAGTEIPLVNSIFDGTAGTTPAGWADVDGTPSIRVFNAGGLRMISTAGAYQAQQISGTALQANTTYLLEWDHGFATSKTRTGNYNVHIGSESGGTWSSLGNQSGSVTTTSGSKNFATDNAAYNSYQLTTGGSVSGNVGVQVGVGATHNWLGYDNVFLSSFAANEIVIGNHSFNMSTRDNQGAAVGGVDNLEAWQEISLSAARGFDVGGGNGRALIGVGAADTFSVEQVLGTAIQADTEYQLTVGMGFAQSSAGITGDYKIELGTTDGGAFTALAELDSQLDQVAYREFSMGHGNGTTVDLLLDTTGMTVDGDLTIRLTKQDATTFFGFEDVSLAVVPEPATIGMMGVFGVAILFIRRRFMS